MLVIESVEEESLAAQTGLVAGDHLLSYDEKPLSSPAALLALEENTFGKQSVVVQFKRGGEEQRITVSVGRLGVVVGPELPAGVMTIYEAGRAAFAAGEYVVTAQVWSEAVEQMQEHLHTPGSSSSMHMSSLPRVGWLWSKIGEAWEKTSEWEKALQAHQAAWKTLKECGDTAARAQTAIAMGRCHQNRSEWNAAVTWYEQAGKMDEQAGRAMWNATALNGRGRVALQRGDLMTARDYFTRALQIRERFAPGSLAVAISLNNLGVVAWHRGDLTMAQDYLARALKIRERFAPNSLDVAMSLNNLGNIAKDRGDLEMAQDYYTRALKIKELLAPNSLDEAMSLNNMGNILSMREDLETAQNYYTRALKIKERLAPGSLDVAASLNNLGIVAKDRGDLKMAQNYFTRALKIEEHLAPNSLAVAISLNSLGNVAKDRGDLEMAQDYFTRVLRIREHLAPGSLEHAESLTQLGETLFQQHHSEQSLPLLRQAVQIVEQQRQTIAAPEARALLLARHTYKFAALIHCYLALQQLDYAFTTLERSRTRSLLELLTERRIDFTADAPTLLLQQQQHLDRQRATTYDQLARLSATAEGNSRIAALHQQLRDLERQQGELTAQIRAASPRYADLQYPQPLTAPQAQQVLPQDTLLLSFLVDEELTFLFAVTRKQIQAFTLPVGRNALQQQVHAFRSALDLTALENRLSPDQNLAQATQFGHNLYNLLLAPAQELIQRSRRLLVCAEGPLHLLPWSALVVRPGASPRYLGLSKPLSTTLSMTLYARSRRTNTEAQSAAATIATEKFRVAEAPTVRQRLATALQPTRPLLAIGDPLYHSPISNLSPAFARTVGSADPTTAPNVELLKPPSELEQWCTRGLNLTPLPHTRQEVEAIGQLFGDQAQVKLGAQATKTTALLLAPNAHLIHFACHGWLDAQHPLSSGLILAQPQAIGEQAPQGDNGLLQAWEILSKLKLDAELVVLSACQSGLGQEVRGEGLVGLTRAFQYAGARNLLVSLWEVHDAGTSQFMQAFYQGLKTEGSPGEALRGAMQQMRRDRKYRHPYYWSAFLLQGEG